MKRQIVAATLFVAGAATLSACGGSDTAPAATTVEVTETAAAPATTAAASAATTAAPVASTEAAGPVPAAPSGAKQLQQEQESGATYWRYSISGTTPAAVVSGYQSELSGSGYTVTNSGGSGGGWGKWGGVGSGLTANNGTDYVSVQAGGQTSGPTYFEVCVGPNASSVDNCENASNGPDSNSKQS